MRSLLRLLVGLFAVLGAAAVLLVAGLTVMDRFPGWGFGTEEIDHSQPVLLKSIQDISQFHAAVGNFEVIVDYEEDVRWLPGFIAGTRTLFVAGGTVNAYVDLAQMGEDDLRLSADGLSVDVRLPAAQLDRPNIDHDRSYLFSQERGLVNRVEDALATQSQQQFYVLAEDKMRAAAEESELLERADENTRAMLAGMFAALELDVRFVDDGR